MSLCTRSSHKNSKSKTDNKQTKQKPNRSNQCEISTIIMSINNSLSYINNAAITLLQRNKLILCMDTFKDSLDMNFLLTEQELRIVQGIPFNSTNHHHVNDTISLLLQNTSKRLDNDCMMVYNNVKQQSFMMKNNRNPIMVLDYESEDCFESFMTIPSSMMTCTDLLLRMEYEYEHCDVTNRMMLPRLESSLSTRDIKIDSAIAFFNYGVACRRFHNDQLSQQQEQQHDDTDITYSDNGFHGDVQLMNESMNLFRAAYHMISIPLSTLYNRMISCEYHNIIIQNHQELSKVIKILMLARLITMNLSTLSYDMCLIELGDEYHTIYKQFSILFDSLYNEWKKLPSTCTGVAAAA